MTTETKKVNYFCYKVALDALPQFNRIEYIELPSYDAHAVIEMGVKWSSLGTVSAEEAIEFAKNLAAASEAAANFCFNGYKLVYTE